MGLNQLREKGGMTWDRRGTWLRQLPACGSGRIRVTLPAAPISPA